MKFETRLRLINFYPPFLGAGIRARRDPKDPYTIQVRMPLTRWNGNIYGTHFGGSLYAMCDPFFVLVLMQHLGRDYTAWDKAASIQFLRPGRGTVRATFHIPPEQVAEIRRTVDARGRCETTFQVDVVDEAGQPVARVDKVVSVRRRT